MQARANKVHDARGDNDVQTNQRVIREPEVSIVDVGHSNHFENGAEQDLRGRRDQYSPEAAKIDPTAVSMADLVLCDEDSYAEI